MRPAADYEVGEEFSLGDGSIWQVQCRRNRASGGYAHYWKCVVKGAPARKKEPDFSRYFTVAGESKREGDLDYDLQNGISKILGSRTVRGGRRGAKLSAGTKLFAGAKTTGEPAFDFGLVGG